MSNKIATRQKEIKHKILNLINDYMLLPVTQSDGDKEAAGYCATLLREEINDYIESQETSIKSFSELKPERVRVAAKELIADNRGAM